MEIYSINNEGKCVVAERLIRSLNNKIYKYITSVSKNVYIDELADIVNEYSNTCPSTFKMKPDNEKWSTYIEFHAENNAIDPKSKIDNYIKICK